MQIKQQTANHIWTNVNTQIMQLIVKRKSIKALLDFKT